MASSISELIERRCSELNLRKTDLVKLSGFVNVSKGLRRLDELCAGEYQLNEQLAAGFASALQVPGDAVREAIAETARRKIEEADARWRVQFKPHAIVLTEHTRPTQITFAGLTNAGQRLVIPLDGDRGPLTYISDVRSEIERRAKQHNGIFPFFGKAIGFVINYTPDYAVRFDLDGNAAERLTRAHRIGPTTVSIGKGPASAGEVTFTFAKKGPEL